MSRSSIERIIDERTEETASDRRTPCSIVRPATDIVEDDRRFDVVIDLPGFGLRDISVAVADDVLEVDATRRPDARTPDEAYLRNERMCGSIARAYALPGSVDPVGATATYCDGVLRVRLPKSDRRSHLRLEVPIAPSNPYATAEEAQEA